MDDKIKRTLSNIGEGIKVQITIEYPANAHVSEIVGKAQTFLNWIDSPNQFALDFGVGATMLNGKIKNLKKVKGKTDTLSAIALVGDLTKFAKEELETMIAKKTNFDVKFIPLPNREVVAVDKSTGEIVDEKKKEPKPEPTGKPDAKAEAKAADDAIPAGWRRVKGSANMMEDERSGEVRPIPPRPSEKAMEAALGKPKPKKTGLPEPGKKRPGRKKKDAASS